MPLNYGRETPAEFAERTRNERAADALLNLFFKEGTWDVVWDSPETEADALEAADGFVRDSERFRSDMDYPDFRDYARQYVVDNGLVDLMLKAAKPEEEGEQ